MSFQGHLRRVGEKIEDLAGIAISDMDGIIVDEYSVDPSCDMSLLVAEYGTLWHVVDKAGVSSDLGASCEICIITEKGPLIIRRIEDDLFLLMLLNAGEPLGKGRFFSQITADIIAEELS